MPRAGARKFGDVRKEYAVRLDISADTLEVYERNYRGSGAQEIFDGLPVATWPAWRQRLRRWST